MVGWPHRVKYPKIGHYSNALPADAGSLGSKAQFKILVDLASGWAAWQRRLLTATTGRNPDIQMSE